MKLVTKISFGMGTLGLLMAVLAGYLLWQMAELNSITSVLAHRNVPVSELAGEVSADVAEYRILEFRYLSEKDPQKMASWLLRQRMSDENLTAKSRNSASFAFRATPDNAL